MKSAADEYLEKCMTEWNELEAEFNVVQDTQSMVGWNYIIFMLASAAAVAAADTGVCLVMFTNVPIPYQPFNLLSCLVSFLFLLMLGLE